MQCLSCVYAASKSCFGIASVLRAYGVRVAFGQVAVLCGFVFVVCLCSVSGYLYGVHDVLHVYVNVCLYAHLTD